MESEPETTYLPHFHVELLTNWVSRVLVAHGPSKVVCSRLSSFEDLRVMSRSSASHRELGQRGTASESSKLVIRCSMHGRPSMFSRGFLKRVSLANMA